jgi:hypothetical protein
MQLEQQKAAIDRALAALREVDGGETVLSAPTKRVATKTSRSEGQRKRSAAKKAAEAAPVEAPDTASPKSRVTPEGRQKLADAMKQRWAAKRAAAKKTARKKRAATKEA